MPGLRVCAEPGCPELVPGSRCTEHERTRQRRRGTRQQRGYDAHHDRTRAGWATSVAAGKVRCWRCRKLIAPGEPWDLGHDDTGTVHRGPEHANTCNRSAAGRKAHS